MFSYKMVVIKERDKFLRREICGDVFRNICKWVKEFRGYV